MGKTEQNVRDRHIQHIAHNTAFTGSTVEEIITLPKLKNMTQSRVHPIMSRLETYLISLVDAKYNNRHNPQNHNQRGGGGGGNHNSGDLQKLYICWR